MILFATSRLRHDTVEKTYFVDESCSVVVIYLNATKKKVTQFYTTSAYWHLL